MAYYKKNFMRYLDFRGIKYSECDETTVVVPYNCEHIDSLNVFVSFDEDGDGYVQLASYSIAHIQKDDKLKALYICNALNNNFRWVKFVLDDDNDINVKIDAVVDTETVGEECFSLIRRILDIVDEAYPLIMKLIWS